MSIGKSVSIALLAAGLLGLPACVVYDKEGNVDREATREVNESVRASMKSVADGLQAGLQQANAAGMQQPPPGSRMVYACPRCGGSGFLICPNCRGAGGFACMSCGGTGFAWGSPCMSCGGARGFVCMACGGSGRVPCYH